MNRNDGWLSAGARKWLLGLACALLGMLGVIGLAGCGAGSGEGLDENGNPPGAMTLELQPAKDNSIYSESDNSNGAGSSLFAGRNRLGAIRRALLAFDLSMLPAAALVSSVTLTLRLDRTLDTQTESFSLQRLSEDWGEGASNAGLVGGAGAAPAAGDATWNFAFHPGTAWGTAGGTVVATPSTDWQLGVVPGPVSVSTPGLADDIAFWRANPASNFGWMLRYANDDGGSGPPRNQSARRFGSKENGSAAFRPTLRIEYTLP